MGRLELLVRRFKQRFRGATYCTIENRSTHQFAVTGRQSFVVLLRCEKCGQLATWDPITGLTA